MFPKFTTKISWAQYQYLLLLGHRGGWGGSARVRSSQIVFIHSHPARLDLFPPFINYYVLVKLGNSPCIPVVADFVPSRIMLIGLIMVFSAMLSCFPDARGCWLTSL